eukprot:TRINITY_DN2455_c0_g1_i1.p1 TRINITY_DN2455_c0_g1~~TRINITY_DN2455_c0_g1_i1.p1  ORF type:complete len:254 (+),score=58.00 TRINITY_DN2455_c0_g1_i1:103-864(+)
MCIRDSSYLRFEYNCSGTPAARALWKTISSAENPSPANCQALSSTCDGATGAHGAYGANKTCDDDCYNFCWKQDVGDCADMDDDQTFCVGQCMNYCTQDRCQRRFNWSTCQQGCIAKHMNNGRPNFVDFSLCMGDCTPVPISPWGVVHKRVSARASNGMNVTTINLVGCNVNLRSVDPVSGKYGPSFCTMTNGSSCVTTQDFIAVVADGSGRYDAGDPFDLWWGDDSWKDAQMTLELRQDVKNPEYLDYVKRA